MGLRCDGEEETEIEDGRRRREGIDVLADRFHQGVAALSNQKFEVRR